MDNATKSLNNPFWQFSLSVYAQPDVADQLLHWQDKQGLDINLFLFSAWLLTKKRCLATLDMPALRSWQQELILPIRQLRISLKKIDSELVVESVRSLIQQAELSAEQQLQAWLYGNYEKLSVVLEGDRIRQLGKMYSESQVDWLLKCKC